MKQFNNYQLYTVLHPEDSSPAFAAVTQTAIRVLKPDGKCGRATMEDLNNGVINDRTESTDVVAEINLWDLLLQGMEAGLPCIKELQDLVFKKPKPKITQKQFYAELDKLCTDKVWRCGQAAFNLMAQKYPEKANELRGGLVDPYYNDERIKPFVKACLSKGKRGAK